MINVKKIVTVGALFVLLAQSFAIQAMDYPLHFACFKGDISTVESLLATNRVDVNAADDYGFIPLHCACIGGNIEVVRLLLAKNANVNATDNGGHTPLHFACKEGRLEVVKVLLDTNRADVNIKDGEGYTPLHYACIEGNIEMIKLLLEAGVDVNITNDYGTTPLHYACLRGCIETVRLLFTNGAQVVSNLLNPNENLEIKRLVSEVNKFQKAPNKLELILKYASNMRVLEEKKKLIKIVCGASFVQMLKGKIQIEEAIFYQLHQYAPDILSQIFEVESLRVDDLMAFIIGKKDPCLTKQKQEEDSCLAEQVQKRYLWLTKQMQERLAECDDLLIYASERFEFLKQQCTDGGTTISTNDRELKMPSFLGLQIVSQQLVEEIEEEEE